MEAPQSTDELKAVAAAVPNTIRVANMIEGGRTPAAHAEGAARPRLRPGRVAAHRPAGVDQGALADAYGRLHADGSLRDHLDTVAGFDEFGTVMDLERHYELDARYRSE